MSSRITAPASASVRLPMPGIDSNLSPGASQAASQSDEQDLHALKRRLSALEAENALMHSKISRKPIQSLSREARAIRRLVTLVEPVSNMIAEHDRRQLRLREDGVTQTIIQAESNIDQDRTFKNFQRLLVWCPTVAKLLEIGQFDLYACREVQAGADGARGDDASTLKRDVIQWITENTPNVDPPLSARDKEGRGLNHMLTGRLICPVDYDWADASVREHIRDKHPDFRVTAYSWPLFLYKDYVYNPSSPANGLFRSDLLVTAFKCIFTSPSSARRHGNGGNTSRSKAPQARTHVAELLRMRTIEPQAIAYVAVQLRFSLSSATSWAVVDEDFDYETFYYHVIEYLEAPTSPEKQDETKELLLWWNRTVFGRQNVSDYRPLRPDTLSVARSRK